MSRAAAKKNSDLNALDRLIRENKVIVCAGSGGVGKTTISAAIGVRAAQLGLRVLVLTVDPARRLATTLGLDLNQDEERLVPLQAVNSGTMFAAIIHSKKVFDQFITKHAGQPEIVTRIMKNRLYQQLSTTLAGSQEFTALERLLQAFESNRYDLVILDTPPTKHAMDFLNAPQRINALFQDSITRWIMSPEEQSKSLFSQFIGRGTRTVFKSLELLTGAQFIEELIDFFGAIHTLQKVLQSRSKAAHQLLTGKQTSFIVVTSFDSAKLSEAQFLQKELSVLGYRMRAVVINRAFPDWLPTSFDSSILGHSEAYGRILSFYQVFKSYYSERYELYEKFARGLESTIAVVRIPEYQRDICGIEDLEQLAIVLSAGVY
jgi:anion-transporting  ArsA/GET3 family ATPase